MSFFSQQISPNKWGIYSETGLLATVSCQATCNTIIANLKSGRRDVPAGELNSLYQVPKLQKRANPISSPSTGRRSNRPPISSRKTRKLKVGTTTARSSSQPAVDRTVTDRAVTDRANSRATSGSSVKSNAYESKSHESKSQVRAAKVSERLGLQRQQIKMAQATGAASQTPKADKAERA